MNKKLNDVIVEASRWVRTQVGERDTSCFTKEQGLFFDFCLENLPLIIRSLNDALHECEWRKSHYEKQSSLSQMEYFRERTLKLEAYNENEKLRDQLRGSQKGIERLRRKIKKLEAKHGDC